MAKLKIKKGDKVVVITGRDKGKTGEVKQVMPAENRVIVDGVNMVKRHTKARGAQSPFGIVEKEAAIHLSNLMIMCDKCNAPVRMGKLHLEDGRSVRICRRCKEQLDR